MNRFAKFLAGASVAAIASTPVLAQTVAVDETLAPANPVIELMRLDDVNMDNAMIMENDPLIGQELYSYEDRVVGEVTEVYTVDGVKMAMITPSPQLNVGADSLVVSVPGTETNSLKIDQPFVEIQAAVQSETGESSIGNSDSN